MAHVPTLDEKLTFLRSCPATELSGLMFSALPVDRLREVPSSYLESLSAEDGAVCLRACMICWAITGGAMIPREMQLRTVVADYRSQDTLISAGTGSGKTLPIALCIHLDNPLDHRVNITVSPLKRLQVTQESDFNTKFHIPTVVINDDTSTENAFWNKNIYNPATRTFGRVRHLRGMPHIRTGHESRGRPQFLSSSFCLFNLDTYLFVLSFAMSDRQNGKSKLPAPRIKTEDLEDSDLTESEGSLPNVPSPSPDVSETPSMPNRPKKKNKEPQYGEIRPYKPGYIWESRRALHDAGMHLPLQAGIHGRQNTGAYSIVLSGGYEDDIDDGYEFLYTGQGGQKPRNDTDRSQQEDQHWSLGNKALQMSQVHKRPVRVIRGSKLWSKWAPEEGYRYDGLYDVVESSTARGKSGHLVCLFRFRRRPDQPPIPENPNNEPIVAPRMPERLGPAPDPNSTTSRPRARSSPAEKGKQPEFVEGSSKGRKSAPKSSKSSKSAARPSSSINSIYANYPQLRRAAEAARAAQEAKAAAEAAAVAASTQVKVEEPTSAGPDPSSGTVEEVMRRHEEASDASRKATSAPLPMDGDESGTSLAPSASRPRLGAAAFGHVNTSVSDMLTIDNQPSRPALRSPVIRDEEDEVRDEIMDYSDDD